MADKPDASDQSPAEAGQQSADTQPTEQLPSTPDASPSEAETPPPPAVPVAAAAAKKPPHMTRTWIAAVVAAALLLGGGVAGFAIGNAGGHDHRPGYSDRRGPGPDMHWRDGRRDGGPGDREGGFGDR
jgi:hypothetical protein